MLRKKEFAIGLSICQKFKVNFSILSPIRWMAAASFVLLTSCVQFSAKRETYASLPAKVNGADVSLQMNPIGTKPGAYTVSAMVYARGAATLIGPYRWRFVAIGENGQQEKFIVHRVRTRTSLSKRDEWYPPSRLGYVQKFSEIRDQPGKSRAIYTIPGQLMVNSEKDGALEIWADVSVIRHGKTARKLIKFQLDPTTKASREDYFVPAEIVRGLKTDPKDWEDPGWN